MKKSLTAWSELYNNSTISGTTDVKTTILKIRRKDVYIHERMTIRFKYLRFKKVFGNKNTVVYDESFLIIIFDTFIL